MIGVFVDNPDEPAGFPGVQGEGGTEHCRRRPLDGSEGSPELMAHEVRDPGAPPDHLLQFGPDSLLLTVGPGIGDGRPRVGCKHEEERPVLRGEFFISILVGDVETGNILSAVTHRYRQPWSGRRPVFFGVLGF